MSLVRVPSYLICENNINIKKIYEYKLYCSDVRLQPSCSYSVCNLSHQNKQLTNISSYDAVFAHIHSNFTLSGKRVIY